MSNRSVIRYTYHPDAIARGDRKQLFKRGPALHAAHSLQPRLNWLQSRFLDGRLVDIARIDVAGLATCAIFLGVENKLYPVLGQIVERGEHAIVGFIRRDWGVRCPFAIGVTVKIVCR